MHQKYGWDCGGPFTIRYGPDGVRWNRSWPNGVFAPGGGASGASDLPPQVEAAARAVEAVAALGQWYEMHQFRKLAEAQHEERRIQWLADYIQLFVEQMSRQAQLDAKVSYYLSREAERLFNTLFGNDKIDLPATLLYTCSAVQRHLAEFNRNSSLCLTAAFKAEANVNTATTFHLQDLLKQEFQQQHINVGTLNVSDAEWLKYRPAEELLEELIALADAGKLESLTWQDIAKSALLLSLFLPVPLIELGFAARVAVSFGLGMAKGGAATTALPHVSKMIRHLNEFVRGKPTERKMRLLRDYADLMLLKLEADTTTRLLTTARILMRTCHIAGLAIEYNPPVALPDRKETSSEEVIDPA